MDLKTDLIPARADGASVLPTIFDSAQSLEGVLVAIEERALSETFDMSDEVSRKACASLAYKVSRSKTAIGDVGDKKAAELRAGWDAINIHRRAADDRLNALRDKVRKPLNEWEVAEKDRIEGHESRLLALSSFSEYTARLGSDKISEAIDGLNQIIVNGAWAEFEERAAEAKGEALAHLGEIYVEAAKAEAEEAARVKVAEAQAAELAELRAARDQFERVEKENTARAEKEKAEAEITERVRLEEKEKREAAIEAEKDRAEREVRDANLRAQKAEQDARDAVVRDRAEVAATAKAEADAKAKREADETHRDRILDAVADAILGFTDGEDREVDAALIAEAIADGKIPHVHITY